MPMPFACLGGLFFVVLALLFTGLLVTRIRLDGLMALTATFALGLLNWFWATRSGKESTNQRT
jgi:hypothetical protein